MYGHSLPLALGTVLVALVLGLGALRADAEPVKKITLQELSDVLEHTGDTPLLLNFFASWCGPCRVEIPDLKKIRAKYTEKELVVIGVSVDENAAALEKFAQGVQFNYPVYQAERAVSVELRITSVPRTVLFDGKGDVALNVSGVIPEKELTRSIDALLKKSRN